MLVHFFSIDENGEYTFMYKFDLLYFKTMIRNNSSYFFLEEDGTYSTIYGYYGFIEKIEEMKKKYATVVLASDSVLEKMSTNIKNSFITAAFDAKLSGNVDVDRMRLLTAIRDVSRQFSIRSLYSPTVSIYQGSGSGKTKLACSLVSDLTCAYVNFSAYYESKNPPKSYIGNLFLHCSLPHDENSFNCSSINLTNIGRYVHLIYAMVADYLSRVKALKTELNVSEKISESESKKIRQIILQEFVDGTFKGKELEDFKNGKAFEKADLFLEKVYKCSNRIAEKLNLSANPLVIISDDTQNLKNICPFLKISRFRLLRRALHFVGQHCRVVFLTLDTDDDYFSFHPSPAPKDLCSSDIYPPFIIARNTDIFRSQLSKLSMSAAVLKDRRMLLVRFAMGRPLWCSLALSEVIDEAKKKLSGPENGKKGDALIACWMIRTGIQANPHVTDTCRNLVKSHMATLLDIHPTLPLMQVCYPSEPVLAIAAQRLVGENLTGYYEKLRGHLACKGFERENLAEIMMAEICIEAVNSAKGSFSRIFE